MIAGAWRKRLWRASSRIACLSCPTAAAAAAAAAGDRRRWRSVCTGPELRVFLIAGEPSGDAIGARLMESIKALHHHHRPLQSLKFAGVGGAFMEEQGLVSEFLMDDIAVMGAVELFPHMFRLKERLHQTVRAALEFQPHIVIAVDSKGFSFRALKQLKENCIKLRQRLPLNILYVAPSVWAWKEGEKRLKKWIDVVDHMLCILPFEEDICKDNGLSATFVGHPVLEDVFFDPLKQQDQTSDHLQNLIFSYLANHAYVLRQQIQEQSATWTSSWHIKGVDDDFFAKYDLCRGSTLLSLLPGSRVQEVKRMMPIYKEALEILKEDKMDLTVVIPTPFSCDLIKAVQSNIIKWNVPVVLLPGASLKEKYEAFNASTVGLCTSGTAVLQMQLARLPCVVAYRANIVTEWLIKHMTKLKYMSLPNILLNSPIIPEAVFSQCSPLDLAEMLRDTIESEVLREKQILAAEKVLAMLTPKVGLDKTGRAIKPSILAARTILNLLETRVDR